MKLIQVLRSPSCCRCRCTMTPFRGKYSCARHGGTERDPEVVTVILTGASKYTEFKGYHLEFGDYQAREFLEQVS